MQLFGVVDNPAPVLSPAELKPLTANDVHKSFLEYGRGYRGLSEATLESYEKWQLRFLAWLDHGAAGPVPPREPGRRDYGSASTWPAPAAAFVRFLLALDVGLGTKGAAYNAIRALGRHGHTFLGLEDTTRDLPAPGRPEPHTFAMTVEQAAAGYGAASTWQARVLWRLVVECGLRIGEVAVLRPEDIGRNFVNVPRAKGGKSRLVASSEELFADVEALGVLGVDAPDYLFVNTRTGEHLQEDQLRRVYERTAAAAQPPIPRQLWRPHIGRHSFATISVENGVDTGALQIQLGHDDPKTTGRYLHGNIRRVADRIRAATPARAFPVIPRQLSLDGASTGNVPALLPVDPEPPARKRVWRCRLWSRVNARGEHPDTHEVLLHDYLDGKGRLQVRAIAKRIGCSHQMISGVVHDRWGFGDDFRRKVVGAFAGEWTADQLFYQVEEDAS